MHASSTLKGMRYNKDCCFDTDKGWGCLLQPHTFKNLQNFKGKNNLHSRGKLKTSFFSHLFQHSTPLSLCAGLAGYQKGVLSVRGFQPLLGMYAAHSWQTDWCLVVIVVWMFARWPRTGLSAHYTWCTVPMCVTYCSEHREADRGRKCMMMHDFELNVIYIISPSHHWIT